MISFFWQRPAHLFAYGKRCGKLYYWGFQIGWFGAMYANQAWAGMFGKTILLAVFTHSSPHKSKYLGESYLNVLREKLELDAEATD